MDSFGNEIDIPGSDTISISPITKKYIVDSSLNKPIETGSPVYLKTSNDQPILKFNNYDNSYYFDGPFLNDSSYISYYKNDKTTKGKLLVNDFAGKETNFYFVGKLSDSVSATFNLRDIINNIDSYKNSSDTTVSGYVWKYYLNSGSKINTINGNVYLDTISESTALYQPEKIDEECHFYGFKFQNLNSSWNSTNNLYSFYDKNNEDITSEIFAYDINNIPDIFKTCYISNNSIILPEYNEQKYYLLMNDGSFDIDNNISSNIEISAVVSGEISGDVKKINYKGGSYVYFPITPKSESITKDDYNKTENGKIINNYKLIVDIEEARNKKLVDPVWSSVTFKLNLSPSQFGIPVKIAFDKKITPSVNLRCTRRSKDETVDTDALGNPIKEMRTYYTYSCDISYSAASFGSLEYFDDTGVVSAKLCDNETYLLIEACKNGDDELKNIIRDNNHANTNETIGNFFEKTWNSKRTFKLNSLSEVYHDTYLSSVFREPAFFKEGNTEQIFEYDVNNLNNKTITIDRSTYTITTKNTINSVSKTTGELRGKAPEGQVTWNDNVAILTTSNLPADSALNDIRTELSKVKNYIHIYNNRNNDIIDENYYTTYFNNSKTFISKIYGFLNGYGVVDEKYDNILEIDKNNPIFGTQKENLDISRATHYFKDMMYESKIGSDINAYKNVSGTFISLLEEMFVNEKISDILSGDVYNIDDLDNLKTYYKTGTQKQNKTNHSISKTYSSKAAYEDPENENLIIKELTGVLLEKLNNEIDKSNDIKLKTTFNDFDFEILDSYYNAKESTYAYFGFRIKYNHNIEISKFDEDSIEYSTFDTSQTSEKQTIKFLHYTSGLQLALPSRYDGTIYDYADSISGVYKINNDEITISGSNNILDSKTDIFDEYVTFVDLTSSLSGLKNYKNVSYNGSNQIEINSDTGVNNYLIADDESGVIYAKNIESTKIDGIYVSPGVKLTTSILSGDIPTKYIFKYDSDGKLIHCADLLKLKVNATDPIKLYYDETCIIPLEYDSTNNKLYDHDFTGSKKYQSEKVKSSSNGVITAYNYEYMREYQYVYTTVKELATFNDWYNVDTYINYSNIDNGTDLKKYRIELKNNKNVEATYFKDDSFKLQSINDYAYLQVFSENIDKTIPIINGKNESTKIYGFDNNFNSIFTERSTYYNKYQGYKMFSFNFKIPSEGWSQFDEKMYETNPNWKCNILTNSNAYSNAIPSPSQLNTKSFNSISAEFSGKFLAGYSIFNRRYEYDSTAIKYNTYYLNLIPLYMGTQNGRLCHTKTGAISGSYNVSNLPQSMKNNLDLVGYFNVPALNSSHPNVSGAITINDISYPVYNSTNYTNARWKAGNGQNVQILTTTNWNDLKTYFEGARTASYITDNVNGIVTNDSYVSGNFKPSDLIDVLGLDSYSYYSTTFNWTAKIKNTNIAGYQKSLSLTSDNDTLAFTMNMKETGSGTKIYNGNYILEGLMFSIVDKKKNTHNIIIPSLEIFGQFNDNNNQLYLSVDSTSASEWYKIFGTSTSIFDVNKKLIESTNKNTISKTSQFYLDLKRQNGNKDFNHLNLSNIGNIKNKNELGYPLEWMTIGNIGFSNINRFEDNVHRLGIAGSNKWFKGKDTAKKGVYDLERFVKPFDMSTNLFYYKSSTSDANRNNEGIRNDDEVIIINARKMYNKVPDEVEKPEGGSIDLKLSNLHNTEFILTGYIPLSGSETPFEELYLYRNDNFEYLVSGASLIPEGNTSVLHNGETWYECRYTDYLNTADQWKLYKLNNSITFTTTNDFKVNLSPKKAQELKFTKVKELDDGNKINLDKEDYEHRKEDYERKNLIEMPCKLSMTFDNLIFKEKIRTGIAFDDVSDLSFSSRIFPNSMIKGDKLVDRWDLTRIGAGDSSISGMTPSNGTLTVQNNQNSFGYLCDYYIDAKSPSSKLLGGTNYYNDIMLMNTVSNSVNRWSTSSISHRYEKLKVFSDYCPKKSGDKLVGTPYCNLSGTIFLKESVPAGTTTGGEGTVAAEFEELGGVVQIAKDFKYINNIKFTSSFDDIENYPDGPDLIDIYGWWESGMSNYGKNTNMKKYYVSGSIANLSLTGKKEVKLTRTSEYDKPNSFYIYFDGLLYEKEVAICDNSNTLNIGGVQYNIVSIITSTISIKNDGKFDGYVAFELCKTQNLNSDKVEIHNIKMPCPSVNSIGLYYNDDFQNLLDNRGYFTIDDEVWQKKVALNKTNTNLFKLNSSENLIFTLQEENELRSSIEIDYDDYGKPVGIFVSLTFPGLNKFSRCETKFFLENQQHVTLKTQEELDNYKDLAQFNLDNYNSNATIGTTVLSGGLNFEYNKLITTGLNANFSNVGTLKYVYNPIGKNDFQLEVITKTKNSDKFEKDLYYINKPVDRWYNLAIYRWDKDNTNSNGEYERSHKLGFLLNEINSENINDISSTPGEIFNCTVTNDLIVEGTDVNSSETILTNFNTILGLNSSGTTSMYNYKTLIDVSFDSCSRTPWNTFYTTDMTNLINSYNTSNLDYENRRGKDLYSVSEFSFEKITGKFTNTHEVIKIFANDELYDTLNFGISNSFVESVGSNRIQTTSSNPEYNRPYFINYATKINGLVNNNNDYLSTNNTLNETTTNIVGIRNYLNRYIPRRIMINDSANNYILVQKDNTYHISPVEGIEAKNIMFVSSPNLSIYTPENESSSNPHYVHYVDNYNDSLKMVNDYIDYFNNPQNRLPAVKYSNHILNSDFATYIYNSCKKYKAINTEHLDKQIETLNYNYDNVPDVIANIWENSQVTRNETILNGSLLTSKLYWTKSSANEFISEVGSIYNYQNSTYMTNIVKIETGSINERQTVLMPVLSEPFEFERRSAENGIIKVTDQIIATAALGYNSSGYPINSILQYNSNGSVSIDTRQTQYLYVSQQDSYNDCYFGATEQKPVYVDAIQQNTQSLSEKFKFLPNPSISNELTGQDVDPFLIQYYGGNLGEFDASDTLEQLFLLPTVVNNSYYCPVINDDLIKDLCYSCANNFKEHSVYSYSTGEIADSKLDDTGTILNYTNNNAIGKYATFIGNLLSFKVTSDVSIKKESLNVFFDENEFKEMINDLGGIDVDSSFESMNCFGYDGKLIPRDLWNSSISGFADDPSMVTGNYNDIKTKLEKYIRLFDYSNEIDMEPSIAVIWKNTESIENYSNYNKKINANLGDNPNNRHAIFDEYYSTNITGFKLKIKNEHLSSAPVYIKVSLLKVVQDSSGAGKFAWWNDPILDLNLSDNYENVYDYSNGTNKEIEKMFVNYPDKSEMIKHSYGIKFTIKQIVPQQKQNNKCIIDNIEIYTSNILNKYGIGVSVEDTFVRKADANCRNSYQMNVNEYVWRMPKNKSEWRSVYDVLYDDASNGNYQLIDEDSYKVISGLLSGMTKPNNNSINTQISNGSNFSYMSTYYFTNAKTSSNKITEVLSDNYLVNSNIKISWKYIDYVYISYSCYSPNSMDLLNAYFGKKIYNAVKAKLLSNIDNMNSNSAFKDRYRFTGGIAKSKNENINTKTTNAAFQWKNSISKEQWNTYRNCYTKSGTTSESYATEVWRESNYTDTYVNGWRTNSKLNSSFTYEGDTVKLADAGASQSLAGTNREHIGQTTVTESSTVLENAKYSSVSEWTKTFMPIAIKFKIN